MIGTINEDIPTEHFEQVKVERGRRDDSSHSWTKHTEILETFFPPLLLHLSVAASASEGSGVY